MENIKELRDDEGVKKLIRNITEEIVKENRSLKKLVIVGIRTRGEHLAKRIVNDIKELKDFEVALGILDITLYRDDVIYNQNIPILKQTHMPFLTEKGLKGLTVILIDDVLFTGRTIRAALDALMDMGRPNKIKLGVLVDRGHRELPIAADYVGIKVKTKLKDSVRVCLMETDNKEKIIHKEN